MTRIFLHGLESSNQGTKARFFREKYPDMIIPNFEGPLQKRLEKLEKVLSGQSAITLIGSSFGGLMATIFAMDHPAPVKKLILLAPALPMLEALPEKREKTVSIPVWLYHGTADTLLPPDTVIPVARSIFRDLHLHEVEDDHMLHKVFRDIPWDQLLSNS
ncbi:MAG: alpha/beta fold hydrolase [Deltaproteobacteria bacterium]|nr:alpha/beta fold hydrolase [Deltaproteobacteria bacterium]